MPCARHFLSKFSCFLKPMLSFRRQGRNRKGIDVIEYQCPHCNRILKVPEKFIGLEGACSFCGTRLTIPADVVASEPADSELPEMSEPFAIDEEGSADSEATTSAGMVSRVPQKLHAPSKPINFSGTFRMRLQCGH